MAVVLQYNAKQKQSMYGKSKRKYVRENRNSIIKL